MSIYILEHKDQAGELLKYIKLIRELPVTKKSFSWRYNDEQFRTRQAHIPSPWGSMHSELMWRCTRDTDKPTDSTSSPTISPIIKQFSPCLDFNKGHCRWPICRFLHVCLTCGQDHGQYACTNNLATNTDSPAAPNFFIRPIVAVILDRL